MTGFCNRDLTLYNPVVTIFTASLTFNISSFCSHTVFMCFVWISEQTAIISLSRINWLVLDEFSKLRNRLLPSSCPSVRLSVEQLDSHWTDFHEIWYLSIFRTTVEKVQDILKSDNNNRYFTWRPIYIYDHISLISSQNEKCFRQTL